MDCSKAYKAVCCRLPALTPCPASAGSWHFTALCNNWTNGVLKHGGFNGCIKLVPFVWLLIAGTVLAKYILNACILSLSKLIENPGLNVKRTNIMSFSSSTEPC